MKLSSKNVEDIVRDSLCHTVESDGITIDGVVGTYKFNSDKLESHRTEIESMLSQLPNEFKKSGGGGWSFLNACDDKNGKQWTSFHQTMEQLFCLGMGINKVECQLPKEMWELMPGGMPYYMILM